MAAFTQTGVQYVGKDLNKYLAGLGRADKAQQKLGKGLLKLGALAGGAALAGVTALAAGMVAFGTSAVREGAAYSKAMSNVAAISGATAAEFDMLSASAETLGRTTKFTAIEAAEGMSFLAMAGFEVNDIIGAMPGVLNLAAAGNLDLGKSADIVSNILTGFGGTADETGRFVDVLTKTFVSSNTDLIQLGQAMKFVAPVAADLGLTVEDTAAAMGVMGDAGIQASMAGTGLRTILLRLAAPTGGAAKLIEELGIEIFDAQGNMLKFPEIIGNVGEALGGMTQAQREATLNTLVGKRAISAFSILLAKGEDGLRAFGDELRDSGGTAVEIAAKQLDNLSGDVTLFKSALSGIKIDVFKSLEPILRQIVGQGKDLLETFGPQLAAIFSRIGTAIGQVTGVVSNFIKKIQELITIFQAGGLFGARAGSFGSEGLLAALGISPNIIAIIEDVFDGISVIFNDFQTGGILAGFQSLGERFWDWITTIVIPAIPGILTQLTNTLSAFLLESYNNTVLPVLQGWSETFFNEWIPAIVSKIPEVLSTIIEGITTFLTEQFPVVQTALAEWAARFWEWTAGVVSSAQQFLGLIIAVIGDWALSGETQTQLSNFGVGLGEAIARGIERFIEDQDRLAEIMVQLAKGLVIGAAAIAGLLIIVGGQIVAGILEGIVNSITGGNLEATTFNELGAVLSGIADNALLAAKLIGQNIILGILQGILDTIDELTTTLEQIGFIITTTVSDFLGISSPSTVFFDIGISIVQGLIDGILSMISGVSEAILGLFGDIDISGLLGSLFGGDGLGALLGGGGGEEISFDLSGLIESLSDVLSAIDKVNLALQNISLISLLALRTATMRTMESMMESFLQIMQQVLETDLTIQNIYLVTLPTLQAVTIQTTQIMIASFLSVIPIVSQLIKVVRDLISALGDAESTAGSMASTIIEGFKDAADAGEDLIDVIKDLTDEMLKLANAASALSEAGAETAAAASGIGLSKGIGLQAGTPALGAVIPPGFPNDSFGPIFVESGERMLVVPRGGPSIEELVLGSGGGGRMVNVNFGGVTISNQIDEELFMNRVRREVSEAIG